MSQALPFRDPPTDTMNSSSGTAAGVVGSTWIAPYQQNKWPVVICDESTPPVVFMQSRAGPAALPAILLGRHKYVWVDRQQLEEWDPNRDYLQGLRPFEENDIQDNDSPEDTMEKQRRTAFRRDVQLMENHKYWHNYILNRSEARKEDLRRRNKHSSYSQSISRSRKMQSPSTPRDTIKVLPYKRGYAPPVDNYGGMWQPSTRARGSKRPRGDGGPMIIGVSTGSFAPRSPTAAKTSMRRGPRLSDEEESPMAKKATRRKRIITIDSDSDDEAEVVPKKTNTRKPAKPIVIDTESEDEIEIVENKASKRKPAAAIVIGSSSEDETSPATKRCPHAKSPSQAENISPEQVKLIFSEEDSNESSLLVPKSSLAACEFLNIRCNYSSRHNCEIIPLGTDIQAIESKLTRKEMENILPYFHTNSVGPVYKKKNKLPFGRVGVTLKEKYVETLGKAFVTASKISHDEIQDHVLEKLKALYPLPEVSVLFMIVMCFSMSTPKNEAEKELGSWVVGHVVDSYPRLVTGFELTLNRLFDQNAQLKAAVMAGLREEEMEEKSGCQDEAVPARKGKGKIEK